MSNKFRFCKIRSANSLSSIFLPPILKIIISLAIGFLNKIY
nr:MAG TPA: hypothetical protein [Caudoviricetes sp.]